MTRAIHLAMVGIYGGGAGFGMSGLEIRWPVSHDSDRLSRQYSGAVALSAGFAGDIALREREVDLYALAFSACDQRRTLNDAAIRGDMGGWINGVLDDPCNGRLNPREH